MTARARDFMADGISRTDAVVVAQPVSAPLTRAAIFLVVTINAGADDRASVRAFCADFAGLVRAVEFRDLEAGLSCVMGIGSEAWDRLFGNPRPAELHPFREFRGGSRHAVATPGDLLFHIRAKRMDLCFEIAAQIMAKLGDAVTAVDEVHGFRYFDDRDLLGFVDGTENPRGQAVIDAALIGPEDAAFAGGSYVITQKYLHDLDGWNALPTETQERIIGRMKLSDGDLRERSRIADRPRQHALRQSRRRRIRHLFHRLLPHAARDRTDDREHVHRQAARQLRSAARLQPRGDRNPVFHA